MKKIVNVLLCAVLLFSGSMLLSSCGNAPANVQSSSTMKKTGTITHVDAGKTDSKGNVYPTEYLFISDDTSDKDIFLKSDSILLDKYIDDTIGIEGYFEDMTKNIFVVQVVDENVKTKEKVVDQMSYTNNDMGINFLYPTTWVLAETGEDKVTGSLKIEGDQVFMMNVLRKPTMKFDAWMTKTYPKSKFTDVSVGQVIGKSVVDPKGANEIIGMEVNGMFYTLTFTYANGDIEVEKGYDSMKSSMKFFMPKNPTDGKVDTDTKVMKVSSDSVSSDTSDFSKTLEDTTSTTSDKTATTPDSGTTATTEVKGSEPVTSSASSQTVVDYVTKHASDLPGDSVKTISQVEIAEGGYVYVTYTTGDKENKVLYSYSDKNGSVALSQVGLFEKGEKEDWVKLSGENKAKNAARDLYKVGSTGYSKTTTVNAGKSLYTNKNLSFEAEYPRSWYYTGENTGGATKVTFSSKPADENPEDKVELYVYGSGQVDLSGASKTKIAGKDAYVLIQDGVTKYAIKGADGKVYVTTSTPGSTAKGALEDIVSTLKTK